MMIYLRKHQKKLLVIVTVMIIASFTFFGTVNHLRGPEIPSREIGKAVDGSSIRERELQAMIRFLSLGSHETLKNDFFSTGLLTILAEKYFSDVQGDFQERWEKAKRFAPFSHPELPFLSAALVWDRFAPELVRHLDEVKQGPPNASTFAVYIQLYFDQLKFPPEMLARILQYQYQQFNGARSNFDPRYLSLFGFQNFEEWFGPRFTEILGKFFWNGAVIAEERGYRVTLSEARADLLRTCLETLSARQQATFADAGAFLRMQTLNAGIDETQAAEIWRKVMLVHRLFNEVGQGVLADPLMYREFSLFAQETATVESYHLPPTLRMKDFRSLLKFQYYVDAVAPKWKNRLSELPEMASLSEIEKRAPELVVSRYTLEIAKITKEEVASRLTLKETWDYETSDAGWNRLKGQFPALASGDCKSREERLQKLDQLKTPLRLKIDQAARSFLLETHPEWVEEALAKSPLQKTQVAIRSRGYVAPFDEIEETEKLRDFLNHRSVGEPAVFTNDHQIFYRINLLEKPQAKEVLTFQEALKNDWIGEILDRRLKEVYEKDPDKFKKPFEEVRDLVGVSLFGDHFKSLQECPGRRFVPLMQAAQKKIAAGDLSLTEATGNPLQDQWRLVRETKEIERSDSTSLSKPEMFALKAGEWSSVSASPTGDTAFFRLVKREKSFKPIDEQICSGQKQLGLDAQRLLMHQILEKLDSHGL